MTLGVETEYRAIFKREIETPCQDLILIYSSKQETHEFLPLSHHCSKCVNGCDDDCHKRLGAIMRKNLVFYAYGEDEVVLKMDSGLFDDLEQAAMYAYKNRLPKRNPQQDGLPGEVLLDLLVQILEPSAYKLAVRTIFRQDDNNEIKGYDLTYFTRKDNRTTLWLGQAKLGSKNYCKSSIHEDLLKKFGEVYMSKQIYFISDKQAGTTEEAKAITNLINSLNIQQIGNNDSDRAKAMIAFFKENNISVKIPCLLAYGEGNVYSDIASVAAVIESEISDMQSYFQKHRYSFDGLEPEILFLAFPIKDLDKLRGEDGFYAGLHQPPA